jgi:thiol-disulfide isomerase/thioredoxin
MKSLFFLLATLLGFVSTTYAQNPARTDTTHAMLVPDSATVFLDEHQHKMTGMQFSDSVEAGHYTFKPTVEGGKLKSMQLVKITGDLQMGANMPNFSVRDIYGKPYRLQDLKGKTLVLNFWFTSCVPCRSEIPELNQLVEKYASNKDIVFLAITFNDEAAVRTFLEANAFTYNIIPGQGDMIKQFGIASYPTNAIVDKTGKVAFMLSSYSPDNIKKLSAVLDILAG